MKTIKFLLSSLLMIFVLTGCFGPPPKYKINPNDSFEVNNGGIAIGRITTQRFFGLFAYNDDSPLGRAISFRNVQTGESFTYTGAKYFEIKLPSGRYEITDIGSPSGPLYPDSKPFTFFITDGKIKYIGSIVGDRDLIRLLDAKNIPYNQAYDEIISTKKYGPIQFFIVDEYEQIVENFREQYSNSQQVAIQKGFIN